MLLALLMPLQAAAQGVVEEDAEALRAAPAAPTFRGTLPPRVDLSGRVPRPRDQGPTGTCVGWAVAYAAATAHHRTRGTMPPGSGLSPTFLYNRLAGDLSCERGVRVSQALEALRTTGGLPIEEFAFDGGWCGRQPTAAELARAARWRIPGWAALPPGDVDAMRRQLARGYPVIFAMPVGAAMREHRGESVFARPELAQGAELHAMVAVGYDDARRAVRVVNSWGQRWGDGGFAWFSYDLLTRQLGQMFIVN